MIELELKEPAPRMTGQGLLEGLPPTARPPERTCGVLVVDDEACVRGVLNIALRQEGFAVWSAADGREALDLYRRHRETIDVAMLDVRMPGWDGPQTLAALRELNPRVRCCFMSGDLGTHTEAKLQDLGVDTVLKKPFGLAEVAQVMRRLSNGADLSPSREELPCT